jgi:LuxR family maltose regulon positive regulatory protein
MEARLMALVN